MKKVLLIAGLVLFLGAGFTSCKKNCKCEAYTYEHISSLDNTSKTKKKDCKDYSKTMTDEWGDTGTVNFKCTWGN